MLFALRRGGFRSSACAYARISYTVFNEWVNQGEADEAAGLTSEYAQFAEDVRRAEVSPMISDLGVVELARSKSWQAAAWRLEHRWAKLFGRKVVEHITDDEAIKILTKALGISESALPPRGEGK